MKKIVVAFALQQECAQINIPGYEIIPIVTGMGKANAAIAVTKALLKFEPDAVISVGTVGTFRYAVGDMVVSTHFFDRDLAKLKLRGIEFEYHSTCELAHRFPSLINGKEVFDRKFVVSTGDDFVLQGESGDADVVDMECFAECLACRTENVPFFAVKYISDVIGQNSEVLWENKLADASVALHSYFEKYAKS